MRFGRCERETGAERRFKIQRERIDMLCFADDIAFLSESEEKMAAVLKEMENALRSIRNTKINKDKTNVFLISRHDTRIERTVGMLSRK